MPTQLVLPPKCAVSGPGDGILPRTPQNVTRNMGHILLLWTARRQMYPVNDGIRSLIAAILAFALGILLIDATAGERPSQVRRQTRPQVRRHRRPQHLRTQRALNQATRHAPSYRRQCSQTPVCVRRPLRRTLHVPRRRPTPAKRSVGVRQTLSTGRIAYLRCTLPSGESPEDTRTCPRARQTEEQTWFVLNQLTSCLKGKHGQGDLRIDFRETPPRARFFEQHFSADSERQNLPATKVLACVESQLEGLAAPPNGLQPVISFRFSLKNSP